MRDLESACYFSFCTSTQLGGSIPFFTTILKRFIQFALLKMHNRKANKEFFKKYEAYENESTEDFIRRYSSTESELRETIAYLIQHREMIRDVELERLEGESQKLIEKMEDINRQKLLEEIKCFKDILVLQKRLIQNNDKGD